MFNNAQMVEIGGKEVKSIVLQDGGVLYENIVAEPLILHFTGQQFQLYRYGSITGNDIIIDWGDGSITNYDVNASNSHTYEEDTEHIITISNVTGLAGSFSGISGITDVIIPNTITSIGNGTFYLTSLSNVSIPSSVTYLGQGVFSNTPINNVVLSEGLESIDAACFPNCPNLNKIIIPFSVTSLGDSLFGGTPMKDIIFLWDSSEAIIPYNESVYQGIVLNNHTFNIPEGTIQLYVDKGYPLERLVEGAASITLASDKDIIGIGETATITGTLNYPAQNKIIAFNTKTPESVTITPGDNYYSIGENGFDITDFSKSFYLESNVDDGISLYISCEEKSNTSRMVLSVYIKENNSSFAAIRNIINQIKLHVDKNNIVIYYHTNDMTQMVQYLSQSDGYMQGRNFSQWKLSGDNSLTVTKNTGLYAFTDSNGQATIEYEGVGAGDVTVTGTYLDKDVSDSITIQDLNTPALYLTSEKDSIKKGETTLLTTSFSIPQENETVYLSKTINDENLTLELTSTNNGSNHEIKTKVTDENDNGLENIRIKLYKEE